MKFTRILLAALLVASLLITPAAGSDIYAVDHNHDLSSDSSIEQFQSEGIVTGGADDLNMQLSIAKNCADVGQGSMVTPPQRCLRVQYNEDVARTVRVYIPNEYWTPFEDQNMQSTNGEVAAEMEPINGRDYTAITLHLDGKTDAVFTINMVESRLWNARQKGYEMVNGSTNVDLPKISGGEQNPWEYVAPSQFAGGETYTVESPSATVQYDIAESDNETTWVTAPECGSRTDAPACTLDRSQEIIIVPEDTSDNETVPPVRYKDDAGPVDRFKAGFREVGVVVDDYIDRANGVVSGVFGG